jgi:hypothetical protein
MDWKMSMDLRCPWIGGTHGFEDVHGFGNIIIIKGDNISVHYKPPPPHKRQVHGS